MMKQIIKFVVLLSILCATLFGQSSDRKNMAIYNFSGLGVSNIEAQVISDRLRSEISKFDTYSIIERGLMEQVLEEQVLQLSGFCDDASCLVEVGQILAVHYIVGGSVSKIGNLYTIEARIIDVESGEVINSVVEDYNGPVENLLIQTTKVVAAKLSGKAENESSLVLTGNCDLFIQSDPPGGTIYINDKPMGDVTPYRLEGFREGDYIIKVRKDTLVGETNVSLKGNKFTEVMINLAKEQFTLRIYSDPVGAEVTITEAVALGTSLSNSMMSIDTLKPSWKRYFDVSAGYKKLSNLLRQLEVDQILAVRENITPFNFNVTDTAVNYRIQLKKDLFLDVEDTIHFSENKMLRLNYKLEPCGRIGIAYKKNVRVFLNGIQLDQVPNVTITGLFTEKLWIIDQLGFADYIVRLEKENNQPYLVKITLSRTRPQKLIRYYVF